MNEHMTHCAWCRKWHPTAETFRCIICGAYCCSQECLDEHTGYRHPHPSEFTTWDRKILEYAIEHNLGVRLAQAVRNALYKLDQVEGKDKAQ